MTKQEIIRQARSKQSFLCVGLDPDPAKFPLHLRGKPDATVHFCREIIEATHPYCIAYKLNVAFFEALGREGWEILSQVAEMLPPDCLRIADAKRADIGNSSRMYARAFFQEMPFDAVTVAPYMGKDSIVPFLEFQDKWTILLALTSNRGSMDFQMIRDNEGVKLYQRVIRRATQWGSPEQLMLVVGATHPGLLENVRREAPGYFFLVPGVGAQGGSLQDVAQSALTEDIGVLVNATRSIIYAGSGRDFAAAAETQASDLQQEMKQYLDKRFNSN